MLQNHIGIKVKALIIAKTLAVTLTVAISALAHNYLYYH